MTDEMKAFMRDMAKVMRKHRIKEMEITEFAVTWSGGCEVEGIEFTMADFTDGDNVYHPVEFHTVSGRWHDADDFDAEAK